MNPNQAAAHVLSCPGLSAGFSLSGRLLWVDAQPGEPLITNSFVRYRNLGVDRREDQAELAGDFKDRFSHKLQDTLVASTGTEHLQITRSYRLISDANALRVRVMIRGLAALDRVMPAALPAFTFADHIADPSTDDRDLWSDGAELACGLETPAWRVFFRQDTDQKGLLIGSHFRDSMARLQVRTRGFEFSPHRAVLYDPSMDSKLSPLSIKPGQTYAVELFLGAWSADRHEQMLDRLRLRSPIKRRVQPASGKPVELPANALPFHAPQLADKQGVTQQAADGWLNLKVPWALGEMFRYAPVGHAAGPITLNPGLTGTYRLFIGAGVGAAPVVVVDGQTIFRDNPYLGGGPMNRRLAGEQTPTLIDFGVMELQASSSIQIQRAHDTMLPCMIDVIGFVPDVPAISTPQKPVQLGLSGFVDTPDVGLLNNGLDPDIEPYRFVVREMARQGYTQVCWRVDGQVCEYRTDLYTRPYIKATVHGIYSPHWKERGRLHRKFDLLTDVVKTARECNLKILGWMRFNSYMGEMQSDFYTNNPQFWEQWESGSKGRKLCLAHPEVRKHKVDILVEACKYGLDGVNLGFMRHPPVLHYAKIMTDAYESTYGKPAPIPALTGDTGFLKSLPPNDIESTRWYQFRAGYLTAFMREVRQAFKDKGLSHMKVSIWCRPNHCLFDGIDLQTWLEEGLVDEVVADVVTASSADDPIYEPTQEWLSMVRKHVPVLRGLSAFNFSWTQRRIREYMAKYDGVSIYEANMAVCDQRFISLMETLQGEQTAKPI